MASSIPGRFSKITDIQLIYLEHIRNQPSARNMSKFTQNLSMFLIGFTDSVSLYWVRKILLVTHPANKKIHPSSLELLSTFKNTFIQVFVFLIGLPYLFRYFNQEFIATLLSTFFLLLTYGYLFFYNTEVMTSTKKVALWSTKFPNTNFCEFDNRQKAELFYSLSNQIKSFIFLLLYYTPIFLACLILISYLPVLGTILLCISQSFFNSTFYFLKKWPYDRFNVAFIESKLAYMLGYGFFVSFVCNVCLSGDFSRGAYFVISQWMIINCLLYSPPQVQFKSLAETFKYITSSEARSKLPNAYNIYRKKIRSDKLYRQKTINQIKLLKPALAITQILNNMLAKSLGQTLNIESRPGTIELLKTTEHQVPEKQTQSTEVSADQHKINQSANSKNLDIVSEVYEPEEQLPDDKE